MRSVTVTIGRNVGATPLDDARWHTFKLQTHRAVADVCDGVWASAAYVGEWDGVSEDAYLVHAPLATGERGLTVLRQRLTVLATRYGQDAIGLSVGSPELVESLADASAAAVSS